MTHPWPSPGRVTGAWPVQYGKPAHEAFGFGFAFEVWGGPGVPLKLKDKRVLFTLHHNLHEKEPLIAKSDNDVYVWRFMCPLSMHQFIEISICTLENKINSKFQTFWCRATRESLCANGSFRAPPPKLSGELGSQGQAPYGPPFEGQSPSWGGGVPLMSGFPVLSSIASTTCRSQSTKRLHATFTTQFQ